MKTKGKKIWLGLGIFVVLIGSVSLFLSNRYQREKRIQEYERELYYDLYRHGFQLFEEQIAYYLKENYSGISKIEFSPIFVKTPDEGPFRTATIVPVVYDSKGNRALMAGKIGEINYSSHGMLGGISSLSMDISGNHIIELKNSSTGETIDVSEHSHLPTEAKMVSDSYIDDIMDDLIAHNHIKDVKEDDLGSPEVQIVYNLEIREGAWWKWR